MSERHRGGTQLSVLQLLRGAIDDFPKGDIEALKNPDYLIRGNQTVGIEFAPIDVSRRDDVDNTNRRSVVRMAQDLAMKKGLPPLDVHVFFYRHTELTRAYFKTHFC